MMNADAHTLWQDYTLYALQFFQQQNVLSQYDAWYQQRVQQWCDDIPVFQAYWEKAREETRPEDAPIEIMLARMATTDEAFSIRIRQMLVSVSNKIYPAVLAFLPINEAARTVYNSLGCVTDV